MPSLVPAMMVMVVLSVYAWWKRTILTSRAITKGKGPHSHLVMIAIDYWNKTYIDMINHGWP